MLPVLLDTAAAAAWLGVHPGSMIRWRAKGQGPPWVDVGLDEADDPRGKRSIRYRSDALLAWLEALEVAPRDLNPPSPVPPPLPLSDAQWDAILAAAAVGPRSERSRRERPYSPGQAMHPGRARERLDVLLRAADEGRFPSLDARESFMGRDRTPPAWLEVAFRALAALGGFRYALVVRWAVVRLDERGRPLSELPLASRVVGNVNRRAWDFARIVRRASYDPLAPHTGGYAKGWNRKEASPVPPPIPP